MRFKRSANSSGTPEVDRQFVPVGVQIAGAWSWRILVISGVIALLVFLVIQLRLVVVPLLVAVLLAALLVPFVRWLQRLGMPKWLGVTIAEVGIIGLVTGLIYLIVTQILRGFPELSERSVAFFNDFKDFLLASPLHLTDEQLASYFDQAWKALQADSGVLVSGVLHAGSSFGHFLAGILLTLFATLFLLIDGGKIWAWVVRLFPHRARVAVNGAGRAGWVTLSDFVRVQIFVAFIDAVGIGLGAWILGLIYGGFPLVIPIAIAVFLGSFIPVVGAVLTGAIAVFVALVYLGPWPALIMLGIVLLVQQIEGHVLQPLIMGNAVKVHPLAVVLAVAAGGFLAGISGALFAVPLVATLNAMFLYIARKRWLDDPNPTLEDVLKNE